MISILYEPNIYGWSMDGMKKWIKEWKLMKLERNGDNCTHKCFHIGPLIVETIILR